jgi:outer membrane protein OmpA-like peptidoglycan-associated protein
MAINLLDMLKGEIGDALILQAESFLGADHSSVKSAMDAAFPSILGSMIALVSSNSGSKELIDMITKGGHDGSVFDNLGSVLGGGDATSDFLDSGSSILKSLMGNKLGSAIDIISSVSGLNKGSSSSIMSMAAPFAIGTVVKHAKNNVLDAMGLSKFLGDQSKHVASALPAGMGNLLDFAMPNTLRMGDRVEAAAVTAQGNLAEANSKGGSLLKKLIPLLLILGVVYFGSNWMSGSDVTNAISDAGNKISKTAKGAGNIVTDAASSAGDIVSDAANTVGKKVTDAANTAGEMASDAAYAITDEAKSALSGVTFSAGSVGEKFSNFLASDRSGESTFRFNNLNFASGSAAIKDMKEVDNLAKVLNAYSNINIEVGGHTDSSGATNKNMALSQARAEAVKAQLVAQGVAANKINTKGYGSTAPTTANAADAANRRVEIKLAQ